MSEVKHTPGPWSIHRDSEGDVDFVIHALGHATGYNEDDEPYTEVCRVPVEKYGYGAACDSEANAAFIVEACNNRDALRAQLTAAQEELWELKSQDVNRQTAIESALGEIDRLKALLTAAQVEIGGLRDAVLDCQQWMQAMYTADDNFSAKSAIGKSIKRCKDALAPTVNASAGERVIEALKLAQRDLNTWTLAHEKVSDALAALKEADRG